MIAVSIRRDSEFNRFGELRMKITGGLSRPLPGVKEVSNTMDRMARWLEIVYSSLATRRRPLPPALARVRLYSCRAMMRF